jgi:ubiquinone/menaquinone biosynthesis C-methylase UbiE
MTSPATRLSSRINQRYDAMMYSTFVDEYYGGSGFHNYGYWTAQTRNQLEASENLVDRLVAMLPDTRGTILDVACGTGASARRLLRSYPPLAVTGINISDKQLATCRDRAPGCQFLKMDAADLRFPADSFDNILCVEAAFHFDTREKFLREARRVLKPGGGLALSDILFRSKAIARLIERIPAANHAANIKDYETIYRRSGLERVQVVEARGLCWESHRNSVVGYSWGKLLSGELSWAGFRRIVAAMRGSDLAIGHYLLVSARKPVQAR